MRAGPRVRPWDLVPERLPRRPTLSEGTRAGDKAGRAAHAPTSVLSPSKSHTFPTIRPSVSTSRFYMWHISCRSCRTWKHSDGAESSEWPGPSFSDICERIRCRVTAAPEPEAPCSTLGLEWRILQSPYYCSTSVCQWGDRAGPDNRQDSMKVIFTPWNRPSQCNVPDFAHKAFCSLSLSFLVFFHSHQSSLFPLFLSFSLSSGHGHTYLQMLAVTAPTIPDTHPSSLGFPSPPKIER